MSEYDNTNRGVLFREKDKKSDKHPDYTGKIEPKCPECGYQDEQRLAGWIKDGRNGKFMTLSISDPEENSRGVREAARRAVEDEDDIPF